MKPSGHFSRRKFTIKLGGGGGGGGGGADRPWPSSHAPGKGGLGTRLGGGGGGGDHSAFSALEQKAEGLSLVSRRY